jgi:hypothetical protein
VPIIGQRRRGMYLSWGSIACHPGALTRFVISSFMQSSVLLAIAVARGDGCKTSL